MRSLYKDNRITISSPQAKVCLLAAFFLPVLILLFAAWRLHLAPFTDVYYMPNSMQETYLPVISELCHKVKNGESIFFTWRHQFLEPDRMLRRQPVHAFVSVLFRGRYTESDTGHFRVALRICILGV